MHSPGCAGCAVYHLVSWPPQSAVLWVCVMELSRFKGHSSRLSGIHGMKKARLAIQQKSTKALHSKTRCAMIVHKDIWWYSEFSNASVIMVYHMSRQSWSAVLQRSPVGFWVKEESFTCIVFLFFVCVKMLDEIYSQIWSIVPYFCIKARVLFRTRAQPVEKPGLPIWVGRVSGVKQKKESR